MKACIKRARIDACIHPETYQYFFSENRVKKIWDRLVRRYGEIQHNSFNVMWIECDRFLLKAPQSGSPVTVLRKSGCTPADIRQFHQLIEFIE